jgi:hypothetical protein
MANKKSKRFFTKSAPQSRRSELAAIFVLSVISGLPACAQLASDETPSPIVLDTTTGASLVQTNQIESTANPANIGTPAPPLAGTSQLAAVQPPVSGVATQRPFRWGFLSASPHLNYQVSYGNGIQSSPGQRGNTLANQVSPGLLLGLGNHWTLDYTPTLKFYSSPLLKDGTDQSVRLEGSTSYEDWTFGFSQSYSDTSQPLVETGAQTDQEVYLTALTASWQMSSKLSLSLGVDQNFRLIGQTVASEALTDTREWSTIDWLNYQLAPSVGVGFGGGFTYDKMGFGPDVTSEQAQGRFTWQPGSKLRLNLSGGINFEQFVSSQAPSLVSPIFAASAEYQMFTTTSISLGASRSVSPSYFQDATTESMTVNLGLHQRLLRKLNLDASGGYGTTTFHGTTAAGSFSGNIGDYNFTSFAVSLSSVLLKRINASVFYNVSFNSSASSLYNYTITQGGLSLGYHF